MADETHGTESDQAAGAVREALRLVDERDTFCAVEWIEWQRTPVDAARCFRGVVRELYSGRKDVARMLMIGRAGVQFCLDRARAERDADAAAELRSLAKALAYDLSANAWPGWNDEGVTLTASDLASGRDLARLNLRLAVELGRDALPLGNAHWLVGAHELAAGKLRAAIAAFEESARQFERADKADDRLMAEGYAAIAAMRSRETAEDGSRRLEAAIAALRDSGSEDATFFAGQLETAAAVFAC